MTNPADLMAKFLNAETVTARLKAMNIRRTPGNAIKREGTTDRVAKKKWADEEGAAEEEECLEVAEWWKRKERQK